MAPCARTLEAGLSRDAESARIAQMEVVIAQADLQIDCVAVAEAIEQVLAPHGYRVAQRVAVDAFCNMSIELSFCE